jgi:SAM-dependent methyltransferase
MLALPVAVGAFETIPLAAASFDVVIFWQSFEHVPDPATALATAARVLRPGGILVVSVPNAASWQARWAGPAWFHWELPRHLYHFAPDTLAATCARAGFVVERVSHTNWEQNPFGWTQSILNRLGFPPNRLFQGMRASRPGVTPGRAERLLFLPLLALGFLLAGLEALARRGGTITLVARRGSGSPAT